MVRARLASIASIALVGCVDVSPIFRCEDTSQCVQGGVPGRCEPNGSCSFPDPTCGGGYRFGRHAPSDVAAMCVGEERADASVTPVGDAGVDADPSVCGGTSLLADNFDDGVRSTALWGASFDDGTPPLMAEVGGEVRLTYVVNEAESAYAEYRASRTYDLRGDHVRIRVLNAPSSASTAQAGLGVILGDGRRIDFLVESGQLLFTVQQPARTVVASTPLTAAERWWQIAERAGTVHFQTSEDGATFVDRATVATPFDVSAVTPLFGGGTYRAEVNPGVARFDDFNGGAPSGSECP